MIKRLNILKSRQNDEGFTLIELMIVVVIIGILAAIAVPIFMNQQKAANDAKLKADLRNMAVTVQTYFTNPKRTQLSSSVSNTDNVEGWAIIAFGSEDAIFRGTSGADGLHPKASLTTKPVGFPDINVSDGTGIGVVSNTTSYNRTYCIAANSIGSSYDAYVQGNPLYYDSKYGITERDDIKDDGACKAYKTRNWAPVVKP